MAIAICGMHYTGMIAGRFDLDNSVRLNYQDTMSTTDAFLSVISFTAIISLLTGIIVLSDLRHAVHKLSYELSRADETMMTLPLQTNVTSYHLIQRYFSKRRHTNVQLAIINETRKFEDDDLSCSEASLEGRNMDLIGSGSGSFGRNNNNTAGIDITDIPISSDRGSGRGGGLKSVSINTGSTKSRTTSPRSPRTARLYNFRKHFQYYHRHSRQHQQQHQQEEEEEEEEDREQHHIEAAEEEEVREIEQGKELKEEDVEVEEEKREQYTEYDLSNYTVDIENPAEHSNSSL